VQSGPSHYRSAAADGALICPRPTAPALRKLKLGNAQCRRSAIIPKSLCSHIARRDAALAFNQPDEAAEAGIRMAPFLFGSCCLSDIMAIGDNILKGSLDRLRSRRWCTCG
jgi:hypothetical protein